MPLMVVVFGELTNTFGGLQRGTPGVSIISSVDDFNSRVSGFVLDLIYIGIGVLTTTFFGSLFWTISGERISRRIRRYVLSCSLWLYLT
jgi:hypothetical protein